MRLVYSKMAGISEARNISPSPSPRAMPPALPSRAQIIWSGWSAFNTTMALAPRSWLRVWRTAVSKLCPAAKYRSTSCTITSVSVSEVNTTPSAFSSSFSSAKFSTMPFWTRTTRPFMLVCGWALRWLGSPWVAQRVCPMPIVPVRGDWSKSFPNWLNLPASRRTSTWLFSASTAMPAES